MDQALELRETSADVFVNVHRPWLPRGARGIFGGVFVAQSLVAASRTVSNVVPVCSMHCTFLIPGDPDIPLEYHVTRLAKSCDEITVRQVAARQRGQTAFLAMVRFGAQESANPAEVLEGEDAAMAVKAMSKSHVIQRPQVMSGGNSINCPFVCTPIEGPCFSSSLHHRRTTQWAKTRDAMRQSKDSSEAHTAALAYITDNYFLCTAPRIHNFFTGIDPEEELCPPCIGDDTRKHVEFMLSLDHSIYFHQPSAPYRADDWMFVQMECPWSGDGRALVLQRIYSNTGVLIATAVQEGIFRVPLSASKL